jgi:hypothetical protein
LRMRRCRREEAQGEGPATTPTPPSTTSRLQRRLRIDAAATTGTLLCFRPGAPPLPGQGHCPTRLRVEKTEGRVAQKAIAEKGHCAVVAGDEKWDSSMKISINSFMVAKRIALVIGRGHLHQTQPRYSPAMKQAPGSMMRWRFVTARPAITERSGPMHAKCGLRNETSDKRCKILTRPVPTAPASPLPEVTPAATATGNHRRPVISTLPEN